MLRVLIVDDEILGRDRLARLVSKIEGFEVVAVLDNGATLLTMVQQEHIDICLLDIHMPGLSGLDLARALTQLATPPAIIFCTAHDEHALNAFDYQAVDYILKPVRSERLQQALARAAVQVAADVKQDQEEMLNLSGDQGTVIIPWGDVVCLLAEDKYVTVVTPQKQYLSTHSLKFYEQAQPKRLLRIHRNALVAVSNIRSLKRIATAYVVELNGYEQPLSLSRRHVADVRKRLAHISATLSR